MFYFAELYAENLAEINSFKLTGGGLELKDKDITIGSDKTKAHIAYRAICTRT